MTSSPAPGQDGAVGSSGPPMPRRAPVRAGSTSAGPRGLKTAALLAREMARDAYDRGLQPGDSLGSEPELLEQYRVSRASLREALRILEVYGLISVRVGPKGGPKIRQLTSTDFARSLTFYLGAMSVTFRTLSQARAAFEPAIARMAASQDRKVLTAAFAPLLDRIRASNGTDPADHIHNSIEFHHLLVQLSGNSMLVLMAEAFDEIFAAYEGDTKLDRRSMLAANRIHLRIGDAILAGDGALAEKLMRTHLEQSAIDMERRYPELFDAVPSWSY